MLCVQLLVYVSILVFLVAVAAKIRKYATCPIHLRWELYPIPHEAKKKEYGGSYYEEMEWWKKRIKKSLVSELLAMGEEIFLLKSVYHHNRSLWHWSYPFHIGLYLLVGLVGLLVLGAIVGMLGIPVSSDSSFLVGTATFYITIAAGYTGLTLALIGCIGLLAKRLRDPSLRRVTSPADYCNLLYILLLLLSALTAWLLSDQTFAETREITQSLLQFKGLHNPSSLILLELALFSLFLLYMPFTRMTHFFAKYFTYHKVRWEDTPNLPGGPTEGRSKEALGFRVSWQAAHIQTGKTWGEVASGMPNEEDT
jgi:nitrate reductase gamma subunit